jgi:hypothetical protein
MRSPSSTVSETLRKSGFAPNCLVTDWALRIGGISLKSTVSDQGSGTKNREQGSGIREQGIGIREQGIGIREQGIGNRDQGSGIREQGTGTKNREQGL